jgi:hypothetical protein
MQREVWGRGKEEYIIEDDGYIVTIKGLNKGIKFDRRHQIAMPEEVVPHPFVIYELRQIVIIPKEREKHFKEYLRKLGYIKIKEE